MAATSVGEIGLDLVVNENRFGKQMAGIQGIANKAGAALAGAFAVKKVVDFGKKCLDLGSDLEEVQNVVDVTFQAMKEKVDEFAKSAASGFGLSETMAKRFSGTFGAMAKAFGFTEQQAYDMGTTLTGLAGDIASFYNITQDEAYTKLKSVFTGETESLKDLGIVMTQTALDSYALANGFGKTTSAMTEAEKVALRYSFVQSRLSSAAGDFARTSGSWANQCRILSLQIQSLMATVGQGLINLFTPIIKIVNIVIGKIATLANAFKAFTELITGGKSSGGSAASNNVSEIGSAAESASTGLTGAAGAADGLSSAAEGAGKAAKKAAKEMRSLMGFDSMNKLSDPSEETDSGSGSGGDAGNSAIGAPIDFGSLAEGENVLEETDSRFQKIIERCKELARLFKKGFKIGFGNSEKKISSIQKNLEGIKKTAKEIFTDSSVIDSVNRLADSLAYASGEIVGSGASIGLSYADNLFGGIEQYLQGSGKYIQEKLISIFDISADISELAGNFSVAISGIFDVLTGDSAKGITAKLIGLFADGFLGIVNLGLRFVSDIAQMVATPLSSNLDGIRLAFEGILAPINNVLGVLYSGMQTTFASVGEMYTAHIEPLITKLTEGISSIVAVFLDAWNTYISPVLDALAEKFGVVWNEHIQPLLDTAISLIGQIADTIGTLWVTVIQPIIEEFIETSAPQIGKTFENIGKWLLDLVGAVSDAAAGILKALDGVLKFFTGIFTQDWELTTQGLENISEGLKQTIDSIFGFVENSILKPFDDFLTGVFEKDWSESFGVLGDALNVFFDIFEPIWRGVRETLDEIIGFIEDVFQGDWVSVWTTVSNSFGEIFAGIEGMLKGPINACIGMLNGLIDAVNSVLAAVESRLKFDFTIPNPLGGTIVDYHWEAQLPRINFRIPELAEGGFVERNTPQLALIGDNRHQGEVVAPEDKLRQMAIEAVRAAGNGGVSKDELENIVNNAVLRIVAALAGLGFYVDGEEMAKAIKAAEQSLDGRFNPVIPT